jgi:hypothetical protein
MKSLVAFIFATVIWEGALATPRGIYDSHPEETAILGFAPEVAPPITRRHAAKVKVQLEVKEEIKKLADGVEYNFWGVSSNKASQENNDMSDLHNCLLGFILKLDQIDIK